MIRRLALVLFVCLTAMIATGTTVSAGPTDGIVNVKDLGAIGDGKADDTKAFADAIAKARADGPLGATVQVPPGRYRLTKSLTLDSVLLTGLSSGAWPADGAPMPRILVDFTDGPCIIAKSGGSVHGLRFDYDHKGEKARKFGPTIQLSGSGISVTNVAIHQPYEGIMADGTTNVGRLNIENVFIVSARACGVYVTNTYDIPTLRNIEVWNPDPYCLNNCIGFKLGRNDEIRMDNCFAFACKVGFLFVKDKEGSTWGGMSNCSIDFSVEGIVVEEVTELRVNSANSWAHATALKVAGPGRVTISGSVLRSNGAPAVIVNKCTSLTMTGCSIGKSGPGWPTVPAMTLDGGDSVLVNGCTFDDNGPGMVIGKSADDFLITSNLFKPSPFAAITDNSKPTANKIISSNLTKKTNPKKTEPAKAK